MTSILIEGFGIAGYRSFGPEMQRISPCAKVNILIGQNNSGKSNILLFLKSHFKKAIEAIIERDSFSMGTLDKHIGSQNVETIFALAMPFQGRAYKVLMSNLPEVLRARDLSGNS